MGLFGFVSDIFSGGGDESYGDAARIFENLELPDTNQIISELRQLLATGQITPEEYDAVLQDPSRLSSYTADPRLKDAQLNALDELIKIGTQGGLTATDKARLYDINEQEAGIERGAREAIKQNALERGVGGSGLELVSQLISGQESAGRRARQGFDVAADAEQRALQAIISAGDVGSNIRRQDFDEQQQIAQAEDTINRFNAANLTDQNRTNTGVRNAAKEYNQNQRYNLIGDINSARQQDFSNRFNRARGQAGALEGLGNLEEERRRSGQRTLGGLIGAGATILSDENEKENVESADYDIDNFLKSLDIYKYDYKDKSDGEGKQYSVMAQDLEKTPVGASMVEENEQGQKMVNYGKGSGVMLAALKSLSDRLEELENNADS